MRVFLKSYLNVKNHILKFKKKNFAIESFYYKIFSLIAQIIQFYKSVEIA